MARRVRDCPSNRDTIEPMPTTVALSPTDVRAYRPADAAQTLAVFISAITVTASADYSPEQIRAWARADERDVSVWHQAMTTRNSVVAVVDGEIAGFSDVDASGYIDMMFVSPQYARRGVASALLAHNEDVARASETERLTANVSLTARPFFDAHGFSVEAEQHPVMKGVQLTNYRMSKSLAIDSGADDRA